MASTVNNIIVRERCFSYFNEGVVRSAEIENAECWMTLGFASIIQNSLLVALAVNRATVKAC